MPFPPKTVLLHTVYTLVVLLSLLNSVHSQQCKRGQNYWLLSAAFDVWRHPPPPPPGPPINIRAHILCYSTKINMEPQCTKIDRLSCDRLTLFIPLSCGEKYMKFPNYFCKDYQTPGHQTATHVSSLLCVFVSRVGVLMTLVRRVVLNWATLPNSQWLNNAYFTQRGVIFMQIEF